MTAIARILVAAVRANPALAVGLALEVAFLAARALRRSAPRGGVHDAARAIAAYITHRFAHRKHS